MVSDRFHHARIEADVNPAYPLGQEVGHAFCASREAGMIEMRKGDRCLFAASVSVPFLHTSRNAQSPLAV